MNRRIMQPERPGAAELLMPEDTEWMWSVGVQRPRGRPAKSSCANVVRGFGHNRLEELDPVQREEQRLEDFYSAQWMEVPYEEEKVLLRSCARRVAGQPWAQAKRILIVSQIVDWSTEVQASFYTVEFRFRH